jgi:hypothetical protein
LMTLDVLGLGGGLVWGVARFHLHVALLTHNDRTWVVTAIEKVHGLRFAAWVWAQSSNESAVAVLPVHFPWRVAAQKG